MILVLIVCPFFYIALSHISIGTRKKIPAGVLIIRRRNNYPRGCACKKKKLSKTFFEIVSQYRELSHSTEIPSVYTLGQTLAHALPNDIAYLHVLSLYMHRLS